MARPSIAPRGAEARSDDEAGPRRRTERRAVRVRRARQRRERRADAGARRAEAGHAEHGRRVALEAAGTAFDGTLRQAHALGDVRPRQTPQHGPARTGALEVAIARRAHGRRDEGHAGPEADVADRIPAAALVAALALQTCAAPADRTGRIAGDRGAWVRRPSIDGRAGVAHARHADALAGAGLEETTGVPRVAAREAATIEADFVGAARAEPAVPFPALEPRIAARRWKRGQRRAATGERQTREQAHPGHETHRGGSLT